MSQKMIMVDYFFNIFDHYFYRWKYLHVAMDTFLCGFLVPLTYVLNTDAIKEFVYSLGWNTTFRKMLFEQNLGSSQMLQL